MGKKGQKQKEREAAYQMEPKERIFASPKTVDEAEADLPSLEYLAKGYGENEILTKEEILERGTLLQKLRLYIGSVDLSGYFEAKEQLTEEDLKQIRASIRTKEDKELASLCIKEYNTIYEFGTRLSFFFKRFQTSFAILAVLLNKWESYEYTAKQLTVLYSTMKTSFISVLEEDEEIINEEDYPEDIRQSIIQDLKCSNIIDGAKLNFNEETEDFYIDVDISGGLYSKILEEAKSVSKDLSDFKAYVVVAEDFIRKSKLQYMPIPIYLSLESAETERYTRYLVKNLCYFRSEFNQRKANGETVTPEDAKKAVIPDFYEVKPSNNVLADCKEAISNK